LVHACIRLATPFAPISSYSTPFELKHALNLTKATRLFVDEKFLTTVVPLATERGIDPNHIYLMKGNSDGRKSFWSIIEDVRRKKISRVDVRTATKKTLAYLVFSSGTSGLPKGNESIFFFLPGSLSTDTLFQRL
jgi:acyl-CoA synthetase (AMP-forming)/AMP-acid ligase II